ncbi:hypothetical protein PGB34_11880 [Xenophilus arseniciresistens]|uniref:Uncharacterized protein n=1 Tax=Xenophilus arseniciresistens TaxID=1283306 RepID=A0AAE3SZD6_9BURK|nr:hypothetical protein [Xenophilus arseniciresistens]MDA7417062.1 hypothetical protein [Xenophilus arseniciresistens]
MVTDAVSLWDVKPKRNAPLLGLLNKLAGSGASKPPGVSGGLVAVAADGLS